MLSYFLQVILFQVLCVFIYDTILSKETFFTKNRIYLLSTFVLSFILPLVKVTKIKEVIATEYSFLLPEIILSPQYLIEQQPWYQSINYVTALFILGCLISLSFFVFKLVKILKLIRTNVSINKGNYRLILLSDSSQAFSFFNFIFLGETIKETKRDEIIKHELVHVKQKHTIDLLVFELLKVFMWFNPMIWMYQQRITLIHEFISDAEVSKNTEKKVYINNLLSEIFQVENISFVNQFHKSSLIKKRIIMITKNKSKQNKQLKFLVVLPVLFIMLCYNSYAQNTENVNELLEKQETNATMIDENGAFFTGILKKKSYMDILIGPEQPEGKEYSSKQITKEELEEFTAFVKKRKTRSDKVKIFEGDNGRKVLFLNVNELNSAKKKEHKKGNLIPFSKLDIVPTFPGCSEGDRDCFHKNMRKFVLDNFDFKLANTLDLKKGKTRIYVQFKINKEGSVFDVEARAPHSVLKEHTTEMINKLPVMKPGKHKGKKVKVAYTLPISFEIK